MESKRVRGNILNSRISQYLRSSRMMKQSGPITLTIFIGPRIFQLPGVQLLVMHQLGVIIALVEVLENTRKHFRLLIGEVNPSVRRV